MANPTRNDTSPMDGTTQSSTLHKTARRGERRLLAAEWDAQQQVAAAQAKLAKAEARVAKRRMRLAEAQEALRQHQAARAAGPFAEEVSSS